MVVLGLTLLFCLTVMAISAYPQTPPPHVDKYVAHQSQPLGPAPIIPGEGYIDPTFEYAFQTGSTTEFLYGIHIDNIVNGEIFESAIFVGEGWDCILATEKDGCIIK
jgi:hypothetical protein